MSNRRKYFVVMVLLWLITLFPSLYFAAAQIEENRIVDEYLEVNGLNALHHGKGAANLVAEAVRKDFNTDKKTFKKLVLADRPFLREDTAFLLTHKEGVCGEGTRVIVNLLQRLGYDATRVTLYNKKLVPAHTLVSVVVDDLEFFVDSINTSQDRVDLLKTQNISSSQFNLLHYSDNSALRKRFVSVDYAEGKSYEHKMFLNYFWLYSYESTPYSKLLTRLGFDVRVFNLKRPAVFVSSLAEKPNMVMFGLTLIMSIASILLIHKLQLISSHLDSSRS